MVALPKPYYDCDGITIYHADCRDILPHLPKVDLVLTDPPYLKEYLWSYKTISEHGSRLLRDNGYVFAYGAVEHMRESLSLLESSLTYHWTMILLHSGGYPRMWSKHIMSAYKPIFVYTSNRKEPAPWMSSCHTDKADKRYHKWGQGIGFPIKAIEMTTKESETVLDPFMGGGQMLMAAKLTGRKAIGIELDESSCAIAVKRLAQGVLPL